MELATSSLGGDSEYLGDHQGKSPSTHTSSPGGRVDSAAGLVSSGLENPDPGPSSNGVDSNKADTSSEACSPEIPRKRVSRQERRMKERKERKWKAPPLSVDSVMAVLKGVAEKWRDVGENLNIPYAAFSVIVSDFATDLERLRAVVRYWLLRDPYASWRMLIWILDMAEDDDLSRVADSIRNYAEKLTDASLTSSSVLAALESVDVGTLEDILPVPLEKWQELSGSEEERRKELVCYYLQTHPYASWEGLWGELQFFGEDAAEVKGCIKPTEDPTLTLTNLTQLLDNVEWDALGRFSMYLNIPTSKYHDIRRRHPDMTECNKACCEWYLANHPAPSWKHVANSLYHNGQHVILDVLRSQYLKDCTPTLSELICFPMLGGKLNLPDEIGANYWKFGVLLLEDATGERITAIDNELRGNAERINSQVFQCWLRGQGRQPVTWATLVAVLLDIGLVRLANDIEAVKLS